MLKFFFSRSKLSSDVRSNALDAGCDWIRDPLAHPDIEAMDERQLADLPFRGFPNTREGCLDTASCRAD